MPYIKLIQAGIIIAAAADRSMAMSVSAQIPNDHPLMRAWSAHKATPEYANSKSWAQACGPRRRFAVGAVRGRVDGSAGLRLPTGDVREQANRLPHGRRSEAGQRRAVEAERKLEGRKCRTSN